MNVAIYNGFGKYESKPNGETGITLKYGGVDFWFPYDKVTYIPDFTMREVDHKKTAGDGGEQESVLTYTTFVVRGEAIVNELLQTQVPYTNAQKGLLVISNEPASKRKNSYAKVFAGIEENGQILTTEVQEIEPTEYEIREAHRLAEDFKKELVQMYFQSKRERMAGGHGQVFPTGLVKVFMQELGVADVDDVTRSIEAGAKSTGVSESTFLQAVQMIVDAQKPKAPTPAAPKPGAAPALTGV